MLRLSLCCLVALLASTPVLEAQQAPPLAPGDRVRLESAAHRGVFRVESATPDTLVIRNRRTVEPLRVPFASVDRLEVSRDGRSRGSMVLRSGGIGLLVGGFAGAGVGLASGDDPPGWFAMTAGEKALVLGILLGGAGAIAGGTYGALVPLERWERLVPPARVGVVPGPGGGVGVTLSSRF